MFDSDILDRLSRVHPVVPLVIFVPAIGIMLGVGAPHFSPLEVVGLALGGYLFWTLTESRTHRLVFHLAPEEGLGARLHWIIHGVHHDHPNDPMRLVMPPSVSIPLASVMLVVFWALFGLPGGASFGAGFLSGYLVYDMLHFHLHHRVPRSRPGRLVRELHMRHHFQDD